MVWALLWQSPALIPLVFDIVGWKLQQDAQPTVYTVYRYASTAAVGLVLVKGGRSIQTDAGDGSTEHCFPRRREEGGGRRAIVQVVVAVAEEERSGNKPTV